MMLIFTVWPAGVGVWEADALDYTNHSQAQQMWGTFRSFLH